MTKFSKAHLRDPRNNADLKKYHRLVLKEYFLFFRDFFKANYDGAVKFLIWLKQYLDLFRDESKFRPSFLPSYGRGQVVLVNFGHRIGYELGGPHYCIVLDADNRKKSGLMTVVPMVSKKARHEKKGLRPWEYDLGMAIHDQIARKAQEAAQQSPAPALASLQRKMTKGSIVDTQQVSTVSKQRLIVPVSRKDALYGIQIPAADMEAMCSLISEHYIKPSLDK